MTEDEQEAGMQPEYGFTGGQRGRCTHVFSKTARAVVLAPDVAAVFPDAASANAALRLLVKAARQGVDAEPGDECESSYSDSCDCMAASFWSASV